VSGDWLSLAADGVFPVTVDGDGRALAAPPASGFPFAGTVQGEGKLCGIPSLFVRLAGCNLRCAWAGCPCDTVYAARGTATRVATLEVARRVARNLGNIRHVVITGGEPLLQPRGVERLCRLLGEMAPVHVTVESNATLFDEGVADAVDLMSLSPKLATSAPATDAGHHAARVDAGVIQRFISRAGERGRDFQLKFVFSAAEDAVEIRKILARLRGWRNEDVLLMPLGATTEALQRVALAAAGCAVREGWRYCDRLHVSLFGNRPGV
jgi:7-carboxy-7-deazaguanine synthase